MKIEKYWMYVLQKPLQQSQGKKMDKKGQKGKKKWKTNITLIETLNIPFQEVIDKEYIGKYYMIE